MNKINRIKELVEQLNYHRDLYYNESRPEISDFEFDNLFDELSKLEKDTGFILATSPTQTVGYEVKSGLNKVTHNHQMLSLDKTKNVDDIIKFIDGRDIVIMAKMDGLTCSLRYLNGELVSAETRGNGEIGEDILHCAKTITNLPLKIDCLDEVIVDGEVIIAYDDFNKINETLSNEEKYKHPRNLASGSIRQLDSSIAATRNMKFIAWKLVKGWTVPNDIAGSMNENSFSDRIWLLYNLGFDVTPWAKIHKNTSKDNINKLIDQIKIVSKNAGHPIDGCVFGYDDVVYGESLGATDHHLRSQIAFKFYDELHETILLNVEWNPTRTGLISPVAIFKEVDLDGALTTRATLHNLSIIKQLELGIGDTITVYRSNMVVPKIDDNLTRSNTLDIPKKCPCCGAETVIKDTDNSQVLMCPNQDCSAKKIAQFTHFVSRKAMNIDGLSEKTLEALLSHGFIRNFKDLYHLTDHENELIYLEGFGKKSVEKLLKSIEESRNVKLENFICALGIDGIGLSASKTIAEYFDHNIDMVLNAYDSGFDWTKLNDFGYVMSDNINKFFAKNIANVYNLSKEMNFIIPEKNVKTNNSFTGKTLCVTGKLNHFTRDSINEKISSIGAKAAGSVSKKTDYLITNESSGSSKYKKAIELGVPIITEEEFIKMIGD